MKKLIHHKDTGLFLRTDGGWTEVPSDARVVAHDENPSHLKRELKLDNIELYYLFNDETVSQWDFTIQL